MARQKAAAKASPDKVKLVAPPGSGRADREVVVGSNEEVSLRFDGFLPEDQATLEAPERPVGSQEQTVGTNGNVPTPQEG